MFGEQNGNTGSRTTHNPQKQPRANNQPDFWGTVLRSVVLICVGVTIKVVSDRIMYKIEESLGNNLNDTIWRPTRYGKGNSNSGQGSYSNNSSSYSGSTFSSRNSNPFL